MQAGLVAERYGECSEGLLGESVVWQKISLVPGWEPRICSARKRGHKIFRPRLKHGLDHGKPAENIFIVTCFIEYGPAQRQGLSGHFEVRGRSLCLSGRERDHSVPFPEYVF